MITKEQIIPNNVYITIRNSWLTYIDKNKTLSLYQNYKLRGVYNKNRVYRNFTTNSIVSELRWVPRSVSVDIKQK